MYGFIYITTNLINGKQYIGQHKGDGNDNYLGSGDEIKLAIKKYGKKNFKREIICFAKTKQELDELEKYYIDFYNAVEDDNFYNIAYGGNVNPHYGKDNGMYGKQHTEEAKQKMRDNHWTKTYDGEYYCKSDEFKCKMSNVTKGELNGMYGKKHTEESKQKMRDNSPSYKGDKNPNYGNTGEKAKNSKKIYQWQDKEHTILIGDYNTVGLVLQELNLKGHSGLDKAIKNNTLYKGYYWSK